jgi:outer membrane protein OmpA-like peptidoglycan-associated protein
MLVAASAPAHGQSIGDRIKARVQEKLKEKLNQAADSATDAAIASGEKVIKCVVGDNSCVKKANDAGRGVVIVDKSGQPVPNQATVAAQAGVANPASLATTAPAAAPAAVTSPDAAIAAPAAPPGQGAWLNYDFIPGDRTIFTEDFTGNEVGDFPRRLRLQAGNLEVVKVGGVPMLRSADGGNFWVKLPERLPARFTVEVRYHSSMMNNPLVIATTANTFQRSAGFGCYSNQAWVHGNDTGPDSGEPFQSNAPPGFVNCTFTVDNTRGIKGYIDEHRTANAPQDSVVLTDTLLFQMPAGAAADDPTLIASIRVAAGGKKLYDVLTANGRVSTQGILFDVGSDVIRPESTPTLKEIGEMLQQHADLKLTIEGHTDNVGSAPSNQTLSDKRAAAVRQFLIGTYQVDASRLVSKGFGSTKPAAPNTTPEGRQTNRRVELVKM